MAHVRIWKFRPDPTREEEFSRAYAGGGVWSRLFGASEGYIGSELLRPSEPGGWWVTIDRWRSLGDFDAFQEIHGEAYMALDRELEGIAGDEHFVGAFETAG